MRFPSMLFLHVPVGDVDVVQRGMVVVMGVGGQEMTPVLSAVQIVRDMKVLVPVL
jgi:hypothetical protein